MRMRARARAGDYTYFYNSIFHPFLPPFHSHQKSDLSFEKNNTSLYEKRHVVLDKTSRRF